jgi:hypothetical protein
MLYAKNTLFEKGIKMLKKKGSFCIFAVLIIGLFLTTNYVEFFIPTASAASTDIRIMLISGDAKQVGYDPETSTYDYVGTRNPTKFANPDEGFIKFNISAPYVEGGRLEVQGYYYNKPNGNPQIDFYDYENKTFNLEVGVGAVYSMEKLVIKYYSTPNNFFEKTVRVWFKPQVTVNVDQNDVRIVVYGTSDPIGLPVKVYFVHKTDPSLGRSCYATVTDWHYTLSIPTSELADGYYQVDVYSSTEIPAYGTEAFPSTVGKASLSGLLKVGNPKPLTETQPPPTGTRTSDESSNEINFVDFLSWTRLPIFWIILIIVILGIVLGSVAMRYFMKRGKTKGWAGIS